MRFQRHAKIFRGQLDAAPLAGVFFLLILFVLLGNMLYTPGVLVQLDPGSKHTNSLVTVTKTNILYAGKTFKPNELDLLRAEFAKSTANEPIRLKIVPGAPPELRGQIQDLLRIDPPALGGMVGTDNEVIILAINMRSQYFFENQMVQLDALRNVLRQRLLKAWQSSKELTLVLLEDKGVPYSTTVEVCNLARDVGIKNAILYTRDVFSSHPAPSPQP
jgi:biopolymer transport protein ExbD